MKQFLKLLLILLPSFGWAGGGLYAQKPAAPAGRQGQAKIDSLLQILPKAKEDTNKVKLLSNISFSYANINPDDGIKFGKQGLDLAAKLEWKRGMEWANNNLGANHFNKSDYDSALAYYEAAIKLAGEAGDVRGSATFTINVGSVYYSRSDYPRALEYYLKALKLNEELGNKQGIASISSNIGNVYSNQSDYPKALEYYFKSMKIVEEMGDKVGMAIVTGNIGGVYESQGDYPKALEYYFKTLKMAEEIDDKLSAASIIENIGVIYNRQRDYAMALEYDFKAMKIYEETGNKEGIAEVTGNIGAVYNNQHNYTQAVAWHFKAMRMDMETGDKRNEAIALASIGHDFMSIATGNGDNANLTKTTVKTELPPIPYRPDSLIPRGQTALLHKAAEYLSKAITIDKTISDLDNLQSCYLELSTADSLLGYYKAALFAKSQYIIFKDSVFSKENGEKIIKLSMKNDYDRQHLADSLKTAEKEKITYLQLRRQRSYTYMGIAGILLLAGFSFFIVKERRKSEIERKRSDGLLLNILPTEVASELKTNGTTTAKHYDDVTVLFTDFVNFTQAGERMAPQALIDELHTCFKTFDEITGKYHIEKIKTIGDAYLAVGGLPTADPKHAESVVKAAIEINAFINDRLAKLGERTFAVRIGIHSGSVVAGIVGVKKFAYDIWGDTVNTAARMEQNSEAGKINISETTYKLVKDKFACEYRGEIEAKGKGGLKMYFVS